MKIKERIKRALFGFFRNEIIKEFNHKNIVREEYKSDTLQFTTYTEEINLIEERYLYRDMGDEPFGVTYERELDKMKHRLFNKVMDNVEVIQNSIFEPHVYPNARKIRVRIFIGNKK